MKPANNLKRTLFTTLFSLHIFVSVLSVTPCTVSAAEVSIANIIQPRADILEWLYKIENGKMYKRLYNTTKNCWEGDEWIYVCDYPG